MQAIALGLVSALCWGVSTLLMTHSVRATRLRDFSFWFLAYQTIAALIPTLLLLQGARLPLEGVAIVLLAGSTEAVGILLAINALDRAPVGVVGPLIALDGAFAAFLAIIAGESMNSGVAIGLALAVVGSFVIGIPERTSLRSTRGVGMGVIAGALLGASLWFVGGSDVNPMVGVFLLNLSATAFAGGWLAARGFRFHRTREFPHLIVFGSAILGVAGYVAYIAGAQSSSLAVASVMAAQASVIAAVGAYLIFNERLSPRQIAAFAILLLGISLVAASAS